MINYKSIIINSLFGGLIGGFFSYLAQIFEKHPHYLKISAFLWTTPFLFFLIVIFTWSKWKHIMIAFTKHALMGSIVTTIVFSITLLLSNYNMIIVLISILSALVLLLTLYFNYRVYEIV